MVRTTSVRVGLLTLAVTAVLGGSASAADTFEGLLEQAGAPVDLATLLHPFLDDCKDARREIDKARCKGSRDYLRAELPRRTFTTIVDDPSILTLSEYDMRVRGYKLMVAGCLACKEPVRVGKFERRFVTLKEPSRDAESLAAGVEVARASLSFDSLDASKQWVKDVKPKLRAQFVYQPTDAEWSFGPSRGVAWKTVGVRVFNHCTGEVVYSNPPSTGVADKWGKRGECDGGDESAEDAPDPSLPAQLEAAAINEGMAPARPGIEACLQQHRISGTAYINYVVRGSTGEPTSVTLSGTLGGTPAGECVLEAARKAKFARFGKPSQKFTYPVRFRP